MVKYTVAASIALIQLAMLAQTSVALPIEYEGVESRAISIPDDQQLTERDDMELEAREPLGTFGKIAVAGAGTALLYHFGKKIYHHFSGQNQNQNQNQASQGQSQAPPPDQKSMEDSSAPPNRRRDLSGNEFEKRYLNNALDRRDMRNFVDNVKNLYSNPAPAPNTRRDLFDSHEYEKRDFNDFEERDWNEFEERDWDDYELEARGLDFDELDELD